MNGTWSTKCLPNHRRFRLATKIDGVYRRAPIACSSPAAVVMAACHGKTLTCASFQVGSSAAGGQNFL
jgi:hypothetical protein